MKGSAGRRQREDVESYREASRMRVRVRVINWVLLTKEETGRKTMPEARELLQETLRLCFQTIRYLNRCLKVRSVFDGRCVTTV